MESSAPNMDGRSQIVDNIAENSIAVLVIIVMTAGLVSAQPPREEWSPLWDRCQSILKQQATGPCTDHQVTACEGKKDNDSISIRPGYYCNERTKVCPGLPQFLDVQVFHHEPFTTKSDSYIGLNVSWGVRQTGNESDFLTKQFELRAELSNGNFIAHVTVNFTADDFINGVATVYYDCIYPIVSDVNTLINVVLKTLPHARGHYLHMDVNTIPRGGCPRKHLKMTDDKCVLIVRHLPSDFTTDDKEDFLKHFGADRVKCFGDRGRMKHVAFASFPSTEQAKSALQRLHQLEVLSSRLSVEFSNSQMQLFHPSVCDTVSKQALCKPQDTVDISKETKLTEQKKNIVKEVNAIAPNLGMNYTLNPKLQYRYPAPTVAILTNIANALASVPRFYVQVLHLMNKMNLPAPFGSVTPTPPIPEGAPPPLPEGEPEGRPAEPPESSSDAESEMDSGEGGAEADIQSHVLGYKRPARDVIRPRKRHKLQKIVPVGRPDVEREVSTTKDLFEQPHTVVPKKIELKLPAAIAKTFSELHPIDVNEPYTLPPVPAELAQDMITPAEPYTTKDIAAEGGFGKIQPVVREHMGASADDAGKDPDDDEEEEEWGASKFVSSRRLARGRLSRSEMRDLNVFKKYSPGEVTTRLYIKNLSKQTTEKDLHYIYGRYVNWESEDDKLMFDIRLMKEGRMKGQAFVTLPNEQNAKDALDDTNGFVLNEKPLVVQFARSAKAKEIQNPLP